VGGGAAGARQGWRSTRAHHRSGRAAALAPGRARPHRRRGGSAGRAEPEGHRARRRGPHLGRARGAGGGTFLDALRDPALLGPIPALRARASWTRWIAFGKALHGLPLDADELADFRRFTGRTSPRPGGYRTGLVLTGRQGGKTRWLATSAAFEAVSAGAAAG